VREAEEELKRAHDEAVATGEAAAPMEAEGFDNEGYF